MLDHGKETIGTSALDGEPDVILKMPEDSHAPLLLTLAHDGRCSPACCCISGGWSALGALGCVAAMLRLAVAGTAHGSAQPGAGPCLTPRSPTSASTGRCRSAPAGRQVERLVGHGLRDPDRGVALRLSAVQLLLPRGPAASGLAARRAAGSHAGAARHDPPARSAASWSGGASGASSRATGAAQRSGPAARFVHGRRLRRRPVPRMEATSRSRLPSNPYGSLFFVTTGFHMAHVIVGV